LSATTNYLPVRPDWLALRQEEVLDPERSIVDAHHHLWDRPGWRYLFDEYRADIDRSGHKVVASIYMQAQSMYREGGEPALKVVGETEFANGVAAMSASGLYGATRICAGIVGHADLRLGSAVAPVLDAHIAAGGGRFCGIRHLTTWDADASLMNPLSAGPRGLLLDPTFRAGFAELARRGLVFDAWVFQPQIPEVADLADVFPDTTVVLDHLGGIVRIGAYAGRDDAIFATWSDAIRELARRPNTRVKLGGLGMRINGFGFEGGVAPPSSEQLAAIWRPYIETAIEAFGADRCMFERNFPVDKGSYAYGTGWNAFKRLTCNASATDRSNLFHDTALGVYGCSST
jgi:predicted TIM-barrel fold metal-dependent hydrolase